MASAGRKLVLKSRTGSGQRLLLAMDPRAKSSSLTATKLRYSGLDTSVLIKSDLVVKYVAPQRCTAGLYLAQVLRRYSRLAL